MDSRVDGGFRSSSERLRRALALARHRRGDGGVELVPARARRLLTDAAREVDVAFGGLTALALDVQRVRHGLEASLELGVGILRGELRGRGGRLRDLRLDARLRGALAPSERDVLAFQLLDTLAHDFHERRFLEIGPVV